MATFSISATARKAQATGTGAAGPFSFAFQVNAQSELAVYVDNTLKTLTTHYTVTLNADGTGSITFTSGNFPTTSQTVTILGNAPLSRTSVYTSGGNITATALETDFDTNVMVQQQQQELLDRSIIAPVSDPSTINMTLPNKTDRANQFLKFDANGNPGVQSSLEVTGVVIGANYVADNFTGDGSDTTFTLSSEPGSKNNMQVYIDGVYQQKNSYSVSGTTLTFSEAPPNNASIEVVIGTAIESSDSASAVNFTQPYSTASVRTVQSKLEDFVSVKDFGAVGDGTTNDTTAFTNAISSSKYIYIPAGTYLVNIDLAGKRGYTFKGAGRDVTNLKNFSDNAVFTLDATSSDCKFNVFEGFRIINRDKTTYTNAVGFYQQGLGSNECDFNEFRSLEIVSMKHGFQFTTRSVWNSFEDVHVYDSISDGFRAVVTDNCSGFSFRQCRFGQNAGHGMYVSKASGDLLANWTFNNVTFEKNDLNGLYVSGAASGLQGWVLSGCYFEENTKTVAASATSPRKANIFIDAQNCYGLVIDGNSLYGTPLATALDWGIYISSTNATGRIGPNRTGAFTLGAISATGSFMVEQQAGGTTGLVLASTSKDFTKLVEEVTGTFTMTLTGVTATVTGTARYVKNTNQVTLYIPLLEGTSNATTATLTGMPSTIQPTRTQNVVCITKDSGASAAALAQIPSTGIIALYKDVGGGAFTASGTKGIQAITLTYALD